jgi:hypothetical protein
MLRSFRLVPGLYPDDTKLLQPPFSQQHKRPLLQGHYVKAGDNYVNLLQRRKQNKM